ncbi:hypothetical protein NM688_g1656 [Phlebia brevispora]|uniref:Uncharacterized protein n=1 Tax=Phlebia brevispora TaxID=194682 RepID=A0ACC1TAW0_9APHY|nr:hypothetical protein NM688_g1656 [Phlebia brevispora]
MKVVNTFHQPSSVTASVKCTLSADSPFGHLVVAKVSRIEVSSIRAEGLKHECSLDIWGRIVSMRAVASEDPDLSNILVLTDHPDPRVILLEYIVKEGQATLECTWSSSLYDRATRHAEFFTDIVVSPSKDVAVVSCYIGKLKVLQFADGEVKSDFEVLLPEMNVYALSILHSDTDGVHTLAILHMDHSQRLQLVARDLDVSSQDLSFSLSPVLPNSVLPANTFPDIDNPLLLISVPSFLIESDEEEDECRGGVLVLGGRKILFYEVASVDRQKRQKNKDKRQSKRKASGNDKQLETARQKDKERDTKKVKPRMSVKWPWGEVTACCPANEEMRRFFIGDMYGRLAMLVLTEKPELVLIPLGEVSPPTTISYLSNQVLYIGSHMGDPQIVQIHATAQTAIDTDTLPLPPGMTTVSSKELADESEDVEMEDATDKQDRKGKIVRTKGSFVEVLEKYPNIAPIMDAVLADTDGSGQPQIVTCSGGSSTGSINVVRTGADFQELAVLNGIPNATNVWPIRPHYDSPTHTHVLVSTLRESLLFKLDGRNTATQPDPESASFVLSEPTLALANVRKRAVINGKSTYADSPYIVQVTAHAVTLVEYDPALHTFHRTGNAWTPEQHNSTWKGREIVAASLNPSQIVIGLSGNVGFTGGAVAVLNLDDKGNLSFIQSREFTRSEISALSCATLDPMKNWSLHVAVAFWDTNTIRLLSLDPKIRLQDIGDVHKFPNLPSLPRSLLLHNFGMGNRPKDPDYNPYVVAGLADGSVACFTLKDNELKDMKLFPLGTAPVSLTPCDIDGKRAVFANGSRSSVLYWDKQRLRQSHVMVKNVTAGASLNTEVFPSCQILSTPSSLIIGQIRGVDKMQIRSVSLGYDNPRRIAYKSEYNVFGVACTRPTPNRVGDAITSRNSFALYDASKFDRLSEFVCDADEEVTAVHSSDGSHFWVGTVRHQIGDVEPSAGRLLLFSLEAGGPVVRGERVRALNLNLVASQDAEGCVYMIDETESAIVAAVNTSVDLYRIVYDGPGTRDMPNPPHLVRVGRWNHNYFVTSLAVRGDNVIVGDAISSVSVVKVEGIEIKTVARHYGPMWPVAVGSVKNNGIIGANADCNLFTFSISQQSNRKVLQLDGNFYLGDLVNKFIPGGLSTQDEHETRVFEPEQLFFTSSGRIGVIHHVNSQVAMTLTALQNNMSDIIVGPGEVVHSKWRTPTNSRGRTDAEQAIGFLDGDFLEHFLTYQQPDELLKGKNPVNRLMKTRQEIETILEKLQSLH